jgi:hypothetical protein
MAGIQLLLLAGIGFISVYFILRLRKRVLDILILLFLGITAIIFVIHPDLTNYIAKKVGVGRGADLVFYLSILLFWGIILKLVERIRNMEKMLTQIIRKDAIQNAKKLPFEETKRDIS